MCFTSLPGKPQSLTCAYFCPGGRPNEAAAELLERAPHPRPRFPAGGSRQGGLHLIGHRPAGERVEPALSAPSILFSSSSSLLRRLDGSPTLL